MEESEQVSQEELLYIYIYIYREREREREREKLAGGVKEADFVNFSFSRGQCEFFQVAFYLVVTRITAITPELKMFLASKRKKRKEKETSYLRDRERIA